MVECSMDTSVSEITWPPPVFPGLCRSAFYARVRDEALIPVVWHTSNGASATSTYLITKTF
jgi:hypothetical protein